MNKLVEIGVGLAKGTVKNTVYGLASTGCTALDVGKAVFRGKPEEAADVVSNKLDRMVDGVKLLATDTKNLGKDMYSNYKEDKPVFDDANTQRFIKVGSIAGSLLLAGKALDFVPGAPITPAVAAFNHDGILADHEGQESGLVLSSRHLPVTVEAEDC
ncbi:hypothetical protein D081_1501 [Anaerovibrio sp. JC8]|uniref:hypothetical protein n=1 Tax=Anaerovibrio sp. JC8 TaxID=1240085 RepID=UPI000A0D994F|nr:hypothetical protein [Anaerovibrio sp. JC8]ORT99920.1 hypothetical protein D081_1501 [Anaerovibrio sp. JC8]